MKKTRVLITGAAGRDFHNVNVRYRSDARDQVVAFTATQIPNIEGRRYPPELAGSLYPQGVPIHSEDELSELISALSVDEVVFSYSDVTHNYVMHRASATINSSGAEIVLFATPVDLRHLVKLDTPALRVRYELQEIGKPNLEDGLASLL